MLHFVSRIADWFGKTLFKGAALPGWMKKELPAWLGDLALLLCSMALGSAVAAAFFSLATSHQPVSSKFTYERAVMSVFVVNAFWCFMLVPVTSRLHREWKNRHERVFIYQSQQAGQFDLGVRVHQGAQCPDGARMLVSLPVSRMFGAPIQVTLEFNSAFTFKWDGNVLSVRGYHGQEYRAIPVGCWWLPLLRLGWNGRAPSLYTDIFELYRLWQGLRWRTLRREMDGCIRVLQSSRKAAGSQELRRLRERLDYVAEQMFEVLLEERFDPSIGAPELIMPKSGRERRGAKPAASDAGGTPSALPSGDTPA